MKDGGGYDDNDNNGDDNDNIDDYSDSLMAKVNDYKDRKKVSIFN